MIRNQVAYDRARTKKQAAYDKKVETVSRLLEGVLKKNDGIVIGTNEDEVYLHLIADGVLGADNRHVAGAVKKSQHTGVALSLEDSYRLRSAFNIVKTAITAAVDDDETIVEMSFGSKYVSVQLAGYEHPHSDESNGLLDVYDRYHPVQYRLPSGVIQRVGRYLDE